MSLVTLIVFNDAAVRKRPSWHLTTSPELRILFRKIVVWHRLSQNMELGHVFIAKDIKVSKNR